MAITYLPQAGSITEKNIADYWHGAMAQNGIWAQGNLVGGGLNPPLASSGLTVYLEMTLSGVSVPVVFNGYAIRSSSTSDLSVTLPANSLSYIYLVLDMAGGGTNTIGQRLVYYPSLSIVPNGLLIAKVITNATTVDSIEYLCELRQHNIAYYPADSWLGGFFADLDLDANTSRSTTDTTGVLVKQFQMELSGTVEFTCDLTRTAGTGTCYVYATSTGDTHGTSTPQLTFAETLYSPTSWREWSGAVTVAQNDVVSVYLKSSNASYTAYIRNATITASIGVPLAPAFHIE